MNLSHLDTGKDAITGTSGKSDLDTGWGSDPISLYWLAITPPKIDMEPENDGKRKMIFLFHLNMTHLLILVVYYKVIHPKPRPFQKKTPRIHLDPSFDRFHHPTVVTRSAKNPVRSAKKQRHHLIAFFQACTV